MKVFSKFISSISLALVAQVFASFSSAQVVQSGAWVQKRVGDHQYKFDVYSKSAAPSDLKNSKGFAKMAKSANADSLIVAFPRALYNEHFIFGGVVTEVSDRDSETLGGIKLSNLDNLHVKLKEIKVQDQSALILNGCVFECNESSPTYDLIGIPILGHRVPDNSVYLDLSTLGSYLQILSDSYAQYYGIKFVSSKAVRFEYEAGAIYLDTVSVYDIVPKEGEILMPEKMGQQVSITTRWYLKPASNFNPAFAPREPTTGVGFFTTSRAAKTQITRFAMNNSGISAHYYIKNVPDAYLPSFIAAFEDWNLKMQKAFGYKAFTYEVIPQGDPRGAQIVTGDIRYNVLEWDLINRAGYGGLGPSIANQQTGEIYSAQVLIQGPHIEKLYKRWFAIQKQSKMMQKSGLNKKAEILKKNFLLELQRSQDLHAKRSVQIKVGKHLSMNIPSQDPRLLDEAMSAKEFEDIPAGYTYETYMAGYFAEMVAHELGHNLGLRHNFMGNLGSNLSLAEGSTSRSIMEYLGRGYRHLNRVSEYDIMAINYGYFGKAPTALNWFCTDEHTGEYGEDPQLTAECSKDDATPDPFGYFLTRTDKVLQLLVAPNSLQAPVWTAAELKAQINASAKAFASYASAKVYAPLQGYYNFLGVNEERPTNMVDVQTYVLAKVEQKLCDSNLELSIATKPNPADQEIARQNLAAFKKSVAEQMQKYKVNYTSAIQCLN